MKVRPKIITALLLGLIYSAVAIPATGQTTAAEMSLGPSRGGGTASALPKNPDSTPVLSWERSREADTLSCASLTACVAQGLNLATYPDSVWDNGLYTPLGNRNAVPAGTQWASWPRKYTWDIRHFRATFTLPAGVNPTATGILYDPFYSLDSVPINDDLYVFVNGTQKFFGGTDGGAINGGTHGTSTVANETDGWYISGGISLTGFQYGLNNIDIVAVERNSWGGLGYVMLRFGPRDPAFSISGKVTDSSNHTLSGVTISDGTGHFVLTDNNGNYVLSGLERIPYVFTA